MMKTNADSLTVSKMKKKIEKFHKELKESINIQSSSTKILQFLVNDTLDFGLLRAGKFRKNSFNFNIKEAVQEMILVLQQKAEFCGVNMASSFVGFEQESEYVVCTDSQRFQQVLLNL